MILFKDILTFLGLDYGDALLIKLYIAVIGIHIPHFLSVKCGEGYGGNFARTIIRLS